MEPRIIGIKKLHKELKKVAKAASLGHSFIVVRYANPLFRIEPITQPESKKYTLADFKKIRFSTKDKKLSKKIDRLAYDI